MAMTKKEKAVMEEAIYKAELIAALRWTKPVDRDVPPPCPGSVGVNYSTGWDCNAYSNDVWKGWSDSISHGRGDAPSDDRFRSASQRPVRLFSTKELALLAMRNEIEIESAKKLLQIDKLIEEERLKWTHQ